MRLCVVACRARFGDPPGTMTAELKLKAQFLLNGEIAMGPGKADLLEAIVAKGSISGAARAMGLSYRRAWMLVDSMNRCFRKPLVETVRGARHGASLTADGETALAAYRRLQAALATAAPADAAALIAMLRA